MKILRKIAAAVCVTGLITSICGCNETESDGLKIITTNFPPYDFVREITGGECNAEMLLVGGQDSHSFEPTAKDIISINEADLFICTGGESDSWVDRIADSLDSDVKIIRMMDFVEPLCSEEHDHEDDADHDHAEEYDEHIWTSPLNAIKISEGIADALIEIDPENKEKYEANIAEYHTELTKLSDELKTVADKISKPLIFGDRFPFVYMAHDYGIEYRAAFSGCSSESEPSAATMTALIDTAKETSAGTIFYIEFSTQKVADTIADAVGADTALLHSCHSLSTEDLNGGETYVSVMRKNIETLKTVV